MLTDPRFEKHILRGNHIVLLLSEKAQVFDLLSPGF